MAKNEIIDIGEYSDNPLGLFEQLQKIWRNEIGNKDKKTTDLIVELNKKYGLDFGAGVVPRQLIEIMR